MTTSLIVRSITMLGVITAFQCILFAQVPDFGIPETTNYTKEAYRAGTQNWSVVQDPEGVMLFGNNKGVLFFDGTHWALLPLPNQTIVRSLASAPDGQLYVGGQGTFGRLQRKENSRLEYEALSANLPVEDRNFEDVWKIFTTEQTTYFCTQRAIYVYRENAFEVVRSERIFQDFFFINDQLYIQESGRGLLRWDGSGLQPISQAGVLVEVRIAAILVDGEDLIIISAFSGIFRLADGVLSVWETEVTDLLKESQAYCALKLPDERIAIGTAQSGLVVIDQKGRVQLHLDRTSGLQNNTVLSIGVDRLHNFWLGLDNGIDYAQISKPFFRIGEEVGLEGTGYAAALRDGRLYLGTNQGLFSLPWPLREWVALRKRLKKIAGVKGQVWSLSSLGEELLVNTHEGCFQLIDGKAVAISPAVGIWKMIPLPDQPKLAIGGGYRGLALYAAEAGNDGRVHWQFQHKIEGFDESARVIEMDEKGNLWVSHAYKGLFRIRLTADYRRATVEHFGQAEGLPGEIAINVTKVQNKVVFTTPTGVYSYEEAERRFEPYTTFNNLLGGPREIHRLVEDENERLWYSVEDDFGFFDVREQGFLERPNIEQLHFNFLQEELVDGFEVVHALNEYLTIIGTERGFTAYVPRPNSYRDTRLNVLLREVRTSDDVDSVLFTGNLYRTGANGLESPGLSSNINSLKFAFAAPFYEQTERLEYRHQLKGYEADWSGWDWRTEKEYTNLAHGDYEFIVQARNTYGTVSDPVRYSFRILPPWYLSWPAKIVYFVFGLFLLVGMFGYFSRKLKKERAKLETRQAQTIAAQEAAFREEREKSEEEIDRLRNEKLESDIQHRNSQLASATMHLVQKGEVLQRIKKELTSVIKHSSSDDNRRKLQKIIHVIDGDVRLDGNWEQFEAHFDQVHGNFLQNLRATYPNLTPKDQKLCAYLRMNLTTKEIAPLLNISVRGVEISRYRLRKKLELDTGINLTDFIMRF